MITKIRNAIVAFIYATVYGIYRLAALIEYIFLKLAGIKSLNGQTLDLTNKTSGLLPDDHILHDLFLSDTVKTKIIPAMLGIAGAIFILVMIITLIKATLANDNSVKLKHAAKSGAKAAGMMVATPMFFIMFLVATTFCLSALNGILNKSVLGSESSTATEAVFKSMFNKPMKGITGTTWDSNAPFSFREFFDINFKFEDDSLLKGIANKNTENTAFTNYTGIALGENSEYLYVDPANKTFEYVGAYITGFFLIYTFLILSISMVERILNLLILFFIGPAMAATIPLDQEEKRWSAWKEQVFVKLVSVMGNILAITFFAYFVSTVTKQLNRLLDGQTNSWKYFQFFILKVIMCIGACMATVKGASIFVSVVSKGVSQSENESAAASRAIMGGAAKLAGAAAGLGGAALFGKSQNGKGGFSSLNPLNSIKNLASKGAESVAKKGAEAIKGGKKGGFSKIGSAFKKGGLLGGLAAMAGSLAGGIGKGLGKSFMNSKGMQKLGAKRAAKKEAKGILKNGFMSKRKSNKLGKEFAFKQKLNDIRNNAKTKALQKGTKKHLKKVDKKKEVLLA